MKTNKSISDYGYDLFSKSMINTKFLKYHNINMKVKEFIEYIKNISYKVVAVGGRDERGKLHYKHIKVWNINDIILKLNN